MANLSVRFLVSDLFRLRLARIELMLVALTERYNGHIVKGNQELLNVAANEVRVERGLDPVSWQGS